MSGSLPTADATPRSARIVLALTLIAAITILGDAAVATSAPADNPCWTYKTPEKRFARLINQARVDSGLRKLKLDPELSRVAKKQARNMAAAGEISHTPPKKLAQRVINWHTLGENVGRGPDVSSLHRAFMESPSHRDHVLGSSFKNVGVHVVKSSGRLYAAIVFQGNPNPRTSMRMPSC
jgi:uncharacterized protein YkwD